MPYRRVFIAAFAAFTVQSCFADESSLLRVEHYVRVRSKAPAIAGQMTTIYTREVVRAEVALRARDLADRVVRRLRIGNRRMPGPIRKRAAQRAFVGGA